LSCLQGDADQVDATRGRNEARDEPYEIVAEVEVNGTITVEGDEAV
jgi:hypothetical protein